MTKEHPKKVVVVSKAMFNMDPLRGHEQVNYPLQVGWISVPRNDGLVSGEDGISIHGRHHPIGEYNVPLKEKVVQILIQPRHVYKSIIIVTKRGNEYRTNHPIWKVDK